MVHLTDLVKVWLREALLAARPSYSASRYKKLSHTLQTCRAALPRTTLLKVKESNETSVGIAT